MIKYTLFIVFITFIIANCDDNLIELNDGNKIPLLGLGTSPKTVKRGEKIQEAIEDAIDIGYRLIDTAQLYQNEVVVGQAIQNILLGKKIKREDIFIISKLSNENNAKKSVVRALKKSLEYLDMSYVDLFLIHWPIEKLPNNSLGETDYLETWKAMEECKKSGLAKSIGVSNFNITQLERIINNSKIRPAANQIEVNPNLTQQELVEYCKDKGIVVIAHSPLGSIPIIKNRKDSPNPHIDDPVLKSIADKYNKNSIQVVLRYLIDRGIVPIPGSVNVTRIKENFDVFDFHLTLEEIRKINEFNKNYRTIDPIEWKSHKYYPF